MVKFLAVGRLAKDDSGNFLENQHQIIAMLPHDKNDPTFKSYKTHVKEIMNKGAAKLKPNKRIRLTSDGNDYDLHVMADLPDGKEDTIVVFFAVTDVDIGKIHNVAKMLEEFKTNFYACTDVAAIKAAKANGAVNKASQSVLESLQKKYANKIADVQARVDEVKNVMRDNVDRTLENIEKLEDLEDRSAQIENSAKQFEKNAAGLKSAMRWKYIKMTAIIVLLVGAIAAIIFVPLFTSRR
jgi:hypothetical protein